MGQIPEDQGSIKLHTLIDLRGSIPTVVFITHAKLQDVNILYLLALEPGSIYVMDRGYVDFERLHVLHQARSFFVTRAKNNFRFRRLCSHLANPEEGIQCDQTIVLNGAKTRTLYP